MFTYLMEYLCLLLYNGKHRLNVLAFIRTHTHNVFNGTNWTRKEKYISSSNINKSKKIEGKLSTATA